MHFLHFMSGQAFNLNFVNKQAAVKTDNRELRCSLYDNVAHNTSFSHGQRFITTSQQCKKNIV